VIQLTARRLAVPKCDAMVTMTMEWHATFARAGLDAITAALRIQRAFSTITRGALLLRYV
jgi:hypothetical protein